MNERIYYITEPSATATDVSHTRRHLRRKKATALVLSTLATALLGWVFWVALVG